MLDTTQDISTLRNALTAAGRNGLSTKEIKGLLGVSDEMARRAIALLESRGEVVGGRRRTPGKRGAPLPIYRLPRFVGEW